MAATLKAVEASGGRTDVLPHDIPSMA